MSSQIIKSEITFHNIVEESCSSVFGTFDIEIADASQLSVNQIHILFTVDTSSSMTDLCKDGVNKMSHIINTLENILRIINEHKKSTITIFIQTFDTVTRTIVTDSGNICAYTDEQLSELIVKIKECLIPDGSTNIESALKSAKKHVEEYKTVNECNEIIHLFLTDGDITCGSYDKIYLKTLVSSNCSNIFIGYGSNHDSILLSDLASTNPRDMYRFIDVLERAGIVYGELTHNILYKVFKDVRLKSTGCEIYNYIDNTWGIELYLGDLSSGQKKLVHLRRVEEIEEETRIQIIGKRWLKKYEEGEIVEEIELENAAIDLENGMGYADLTQYIFRQRTQEILFEAKKSLSKSNTLAEKNVLTKRLKVLQDELVSYKTSLTDNEQILFVTHLCDDIYITRKAITKPKNIANMYITTRQVSQGRQESYNCSDIDENQVLFGNTVFTKPVCLQRQQTASYSQATDYGIDDYEEQNIEDNNDESDNYVFSQNMLTPYTTLKMVDVMRSVSGNRNI